MTARSWQVPEGPRVTSLSGVPGGPGASICSRIVGRSTRQAGRHQASSLTWLKGYFKFRLWRARDAPEPMLKDRRGYVGAESRADRLAWLARMLRGLFSNVEAITDND